VGILPESPYLYQYLTADEIMDLCGRLVGLDRRERVQRSRELIARVGLEGRSDRAVRKYSKGMLQRLGLAQALLGEPDLLILDEPMTGLDPIGRKEVRDLILEERQRGRTVMFSSHILSDVEMLCDRVAIVRAGELAACGTLRELLRPEVRAVEIELDAVTPALASALDGLHAAHAPYQAHVMVTVQGEGEVAQVLQAALGAGARVVAVTPRRETLEDLFVRKAIG
jgi:ABC-2 type transport system ATP-binding protein